MAKYDIPICKKCGRSLEYKLDKGRWITYDKLAGSPHRTVCVAKSRLFKTNDILIGFFLTSTKVYQVLELDEVSASYYLFNNIGIKTMTFKFVDDKFKLMDKIYELLYL
jgi:hypothetical protein